MPSIIEAFLSERVCSFFLEEEKENKGSYNENVPCAELRGVCFFCIINENLIVFNLRSATVD